MVEEIPICPIEDLEPAPDAAPFATLQRAEAAVIEPPHRFYRLPPTSLLNEPPGKNPYDEQELKETAGLIKAKFEEFNVLGNVVQINPGPVVTTFEFKPEAGMKYSRITNLSEDLCLGLAGRIDSDRANSRQADGRHRSAEYAARADRAAADARIGRVHVLATRT